ncbi:helix-turn-helix transcriptional regulator [Xanthobacter dioxanivorans]|uniref:Helix-turn-helix transcriptional regulator n=1 Tax=Xanthobacter dioxanivorans TaxID=2528964 RepID=A0A974PLZ7_9HYPH|nr:AraC family transcriptional regulator [Xanthobacter dioxanivorans]QRG05736.1 helix-turn-helix transcriptional regulator [Xanthobacter dioxanivorans]
MEIPQHLFVGTVDGEPNCAPDTTVYEIWPKFVVMVLLSGAQHFVIDDSAFRIEAGNGEDERAVVFLLNVARFSRLRFVNDSNIPLRKIMISAPHPWMEWLMRTRGNASSALRDFLTTHLAQLSFPVSGQVRQLSEQILQPPPSMDGEVRTLYRNSRALDIMCLACVAMAERAEEERPRPQLVSRRRSERVRDYVLDNLDKSLTIEEIAAEVGASVSSVQRHFKEHFQMTVFEFIRRERLAQAYASLEREGVTIAQAAYAAGYADPSNFTVAFKKLYGVPPKFKRR